MKKVYIIFTLLFVTLFVSSCETYEDYNTERGAVIGFTLGVDLELTLSDSNPIIVFNIPYFVSDASSSDRTFQVVVIAEESDVASENYSFDAAVVVPANERLGTFEFTAMDISLTNEFAPLVLAFEETATVTSGSRVHIFLKNND